MAINVRFLQRSGLIRPAALAAVGLNVSATLMTQVLLLAAAVVVAPSLLIQACFFRRQASLPEPRARRAAVAAIALAVLLAFLFCVALSADRPRMAAAAGRAVTDKVTEPEHLLARQDGPCRATVAGCVRFAADARAGGAAGRRQPGAGGVRVGCLPGGRRWPRGPFTRRLRCTRRDFWSVAWSRSGLPP